MGEEHRLQESSRPCANNNCGFFGNPMTLDLCSKCYRDLCLKEKQYSLADVIDIPLQKTLSSPLPSLAAALSSLESSSAAVPSHEAGAGAVRAPQASRCAGCKRKVGLAGFRCRCGSTFCGAHRHPEQHACEFDFRRAGREEIARANPMVKAPKLEKM